MSGPPPNYYRILEVSESASTPQIRDAYKRAALKTHPDRVPADSPERPQRTRKFQLVNDAYYTLSDTTRRREYDAQRKMFGGGGGGSGARYSAPFDDVDDPEEEEVPSSSGAGASTGGGGGFPSWAWNFFTGNKGTDSANAQQQQQRAQNDQFGGVFEEMLREEGLAEGEGNKPNGKFWAMAGGLSGGVLGFILANFPGLMAGAVAGNKLGGVRDAKGKSVYEVFQTLPQSERATLLTQLAAKVFSHTVGA